MALPLQELKTTIEEELEKNPALPVEEDRSTVSLESMPEQRSKGATRPTLRPQLRPGLLPRRAAEEASDAPAQFIEGVLSRPESLQDHLLWQLALQPIPENCARVGELLDPQPRRATASTGSRPRPPR